MTWNLGQIRAEIRLGVDERTEAGYDMRTSMKRMNEVTDLNDSKSRTEEAEKHCSGLSICWARRADIEMGEMRLHGGNPGSIMQRCRRGLPSCSECASMFAMLKTASIYSGWTYLPVEIAGRGFV